MWKEEEDARDYASWSDFHDDVLDVQWSVWRTHISDSTKTEASEDVVPVIGPLAKMLEAHRRRDGRGPWIFAGEKMGRPLSLDNLIRRVIHPAIGDRWFGWYAFRRGITTTLYDLGVPPEVSQKVLRHADASVTRKHYLLLQSTKQGRAAMKKLERKVVKVADKHGGSSKRRK